ncbi:hypothetical protein HZZ02_05485 [Streptococcus danieliae]|nr:hypothetical protein [Streptococcus danieliae]
MNSRQDREDELDQPFTDELEEEVSEEKANGEQKRKIALLNFRKAHTLLLICLLALLAIYILNFFWTPANSDITNQITEAFKTVLFTLSGFLYAKKDD